MLAAFEQAVEDGFPTAATTVARFTQLMAGYFSTVGGDATPQALMTHVLRH